MTGTGPLDEMTKVMGLRRVVAHQTTRGAKKKAAQQGGLSWKVAVVQSLQ
jgi:hypothetical protein